MKKVAVFGNAGGGKSTLAWRLSEMTGLPLHVVDKMQFRAGGAEVPHEEFLRAHAELLVRDEWIIDGFGTEATAWERFAVADTLIHVDLPLAVHHWWVTKRLLMGCLPIHSAGRNEAHCGAAPWRAIACCGSATATSRPSTGSSSPKLLAPSVCIT